MPRLRKWLAIAAALLAVGCASSPPIGRSDLLEFLADGSTTRADAVLRLGTPSGTYEAGHIMTYRLARDEAGWVPVDFVRSGTRTDWSDIVANLVLVFDEQGVLRRHSLVQVRAR